MFDAAVKRLYRYSSAVILKLLNWMPSPTIIAWPNFLVLKSQLFHVKLAIPTIAILHGLRKSRVVHTQRQSRASTGDNTALVEMIIRTLQSWTEMITAVHHRKWRGSSMPEPSSGQSSLRTYPIVPLIRISFKLFVGARFSISSYV